MANRLRDARLRREIEGDAPASGNAQLKRLRLTRVENEVELHERFGGVRVEQVQLLEAIGVRNPVGEHEGRRGAREPERQADAAAAVAVVELQRLDDQASATRFDLSAYVGAAPDVRADVERDESVGGNDHALERRGCVAALLGRKREVDDGVVGERVEQRVDELGGARRRPFGHEPLCRGRRCAHAGGVADRTGGGVFDDGAAAV